MSVSIGKAEADRPGRIFLICLTLGWLLAGVWLASLVFGHGGFSFFSHYSDAAIRYQVLCIILFLASPFLRPGDRWTVLALSSLWLTYWWLEGLIQSLSWTYFGDRVWGQLPFDPWDIVHVPVTILYASIAWYAWRRRRCEWHWRRSAPNNAQFAFPPC